MARRVVRGLVSKKKKRFQVDSFDLDLSYITPRIIAMGFPSTGTEKFYRNPLQEVKRFFDERHSDHFMIYNLCSEREYPPSEFKGNVQRFPFDDHNPCQLEVIGAFCKSVDEFLDAHPDNVVAIHCKAGKGRTGLMISAYLLHCGLVSDAEEALSLFARERTKDGKGVTIPSQMRYVHYYSYTLTYGTPVTVPVYRIVFVRLCGIPNFDSSGGCVPYFNVKMNGQKLFTFKKTTKRLRKYKKHEKYVDFDVSTYDVRVQGDVLMTFRHEQNMGRTQEMCHFWFHTAFVGPGYLRLTKNVIDKANKDKHHKSFHEKFAIEVYFQRVDGVIAQRGVRISSDPLEEPLPGIAEANLGDKDTAYSSRSLLEFSSETKAQGMDGLDTQSVDSSDTAVLPSSSFNDGDKASDEETSVPSASFHGSTGSVGGEEAKEGEPVFTINPSKLRIGPGRKIARASFVADWDTKPPPKVAKPKKP